MKILVLNGSPRKNGTVVSLLKAITAPLSAEHEIEWIDVVADADFLKSGTCSVKHLDYGRFSEAPNDRSWKNHPQPMGYPQSATGVPRSSVGLAKS